MVRLHINYNNRVRYWDCASAWSGNLIAIGVMRTDAEAVSVDMVDMTTGEVLKHYVKG